MPNHVTNIIRIADLGASSLEAVHAALLNEDREVDFNVIAQMPKCLEGFNPHHGVLDAAKRALGLFIAPDKETGDMSNVINNMTFSTALKGMCSPTKKEDIPDLIKAIQNHQECGYLYWYEWQTENWGTKWNAYDQPNKGFSDGVLEFRFQTAWSHPHDLILMLSKKLPEVTFDVVFADEDTGSNCGHYSCKSGKTFKGVIAPSWSEMTEKEKATWTCFAFNINNPNVDPREYGYGPNWVYSEEVADNYEQHSKLN